MRYDYARNKLSTHSSRSRGRTRARRGIFGLVFGFMLGLLVAGVGYWKLQGIALPYWFNKNTVAAAPSVAPLDPDTAPSKTPSSNSDNHAVKPVTAPRFDFYTMLPQHNDTTQKTLVGGVPQPEKIAEPKKNTLTVANLPETGRYYLQLAAFQEFAEADQLRAQVLMVGFDANIQRIQRNEINWYRVRLGPYRTKREVLQAQQQLRANRFSSTIFVEASPNNQRTA